MSPEEYRAKRDWLRLHSHGLRAETVKRELRAWDRELESQGVTVEAWSKPTASTPWHVAFFHDRPRQPAGQRVPSRGSRLPAPQPPRE